MTCEAMIELIKEAEKQNWAKVGAFYFEGHPTIRVEYRGMANWAIVDGQQNLNHDGDWEWEPLPSSRDTAFFERCRYTLDEALKFAGEYVEAQARESET